MKPWQMTYDEVRNAVSPSTRSELEASRPILRELFSDKLDDVGDPWGIVRAVTRGDELPRTPTVDLSLRHRESISKALAEGRKVPARVLREYPGIKAKSVVALLLMAGLAAAMSRQSKQSEA